MRPLALALALALAVVACGSDDIDGLQFDTTGADGHGGSLADAAADAPVGVVEDAGPDGLGGFGGSSDDAGTEGDAEPVEDAGPDALEDAGPDVSDDVEEDAGDELPEAGPIGPPYNNENVRCLVKDGNATRIYTCEGMWGPRWGMRYVGIDNKMYTCDGRPEDDQTYRAPCKEGGTCAIFRKEDTLYGTCIK